MEGLSVIIVCHNSATRLPIALSHLKAQSEVSFPWELLIVDNASTDKTADIARSCWPNGLAPLRVISEPRLGVRHARERGYAEAIYPFLAFIDDDNWVAPDWLSLAHNIISSDSGLGAVGSILEPVYESPCRPWFEHFHSTYAVVTENDLAKMQQPLTFLPTAGLCMRKEAWDDLVCNGFRFFLTGTVGKKPKGGEDTELTRALYLAGWRLCIDPRLRLQHFMPNHRLRWTYLRDLERGYAESHVPLDAYTRASLSCSPGFRRWLSEHWWFQLGKSLLRIAIRPSGIIAALALDNEGQKGVIEIERQMGRILGLLRLRGQYGAFRREVRRAPWRCRGIA
jgi:glycosyltransferase involved in cell wall biosynthesis